MFLFVLGDSYTWMAIEARTKLVLDHVVGNAHQDAVELMRKPPRNQAAQRFRLTTDGL